MTPARDDAVNELPAIAEFDVNPLIALAPGRSVEAVDYRTRRSRTAAGG